MLFLGVVRVETYLAGLAFFAKLDVDIYRFDFTFKVFKLGTRCYDSHGKNKVVNLPLTTEKVCCRYGPVYQNIH